jgi:hypothetical protein
MFTIEPPSSCACITALAFWAKCSGATRLSWRIFSEKRGEAVAASAAGEPPALLTSTSRRPKRSVVVVTTRSI